MSDNMFESDLTVQSDTDTDTDVADTQLTENPLADRTLPEADSSTADDDTTTEAPKRVLSRLSSSDASPRRSKRDTMDGKSFFIFSQDNRVRKLCWDFCHSNYCEGFILFCIFINVLFLMIQTPANLYNGYVSEGANTMMNAIDLLTTCIFTGEVVIRSIALGFASGQNSYLKDPWNVMDFTLVLTAWCSDIIYQDTNAPIKPTIFRCLRVMRPVRNMPFFAGMRAVLQFWPFLGHVCSFLFFFFCVFGVIGMQLFGGLLTHRCTDGMSNATLTLKTTAGVEFRQCPHQLACEDMARCEVITTDTYNDTVVYADARTKEIGIYGFDNIGQSFLTQFVVTTMDEWPALSHPLIQSDGKFKWMIWSFFATMVVVLGLITSNLFVSVIVYAFANGHNSEEDPEIAKEQVRKLRSLFTRIDASGDGEVAVSEIGVLAETLGITLSDAELSTTVAEMDFDGSGLVDFAEFCEWWKEDTPVGMQFRRAIGMEESLIRAVFDKVDADGSGELDPAEIIELSARLGITLSQYELDTALREMDNDGDTAVTFDEFLAWWLSDSAVANKMSVAAHGEKQKLQKRFDGIVADGSGKLTDEHCAAIGKSFGAKISSAEAKEIFAELVEPGTTEATFEQYAAWWKSDAKQATRLRDEQQDAEMRVRILFDRVDEAGSGTIDADEIVAICKLGQVHLTEASALEIIREMEVENGNDSVEFDEFYPWLFSGTEWAGKIMKVIDQVVFDEQQPGFPFIPGLSPTCRTITLSDWFEYLMVGIVTLNTMIMACEHYQQPQWLTTFLLVVEVVFAIIYCFEALIKIFGLSAKVYFRAGLNKLDFLIALASLAGLLLPEFKGLTAFRILRLIIKLMRVMRMVKLLSKYDAIVSLLRTVVGSSGMLGALSAFIIFALGLLSIFASHTLGNCHASADQYSAYTVINNTAVFKVDGVDTVGENFPRYNFYTPLDAIITNFQIMTGEDWTVVMYYYMHCYSSYSWIYFVCVFSLTNFVLLNMFVAVILENFEFSHEEKLIKQERKFLKSLEAKDGGSIDVAEDLKESSLKGRNEAKQVRSKFKMTRFFKNKQIEEEPQEGDEDWNRTEGHDDGPADVALCCLTPENGLRKACYNIASSHAFDNLVLGIILVSSVLLAVEGPRNAEYLEGKDGLKTFMHIADYFCITFFFLEMLIKIIAYGFYGTPNPYITDRWNQLDFLVVNFSLVELLVAAFSSNAQDAVSVRVLRLLRVLRPLRMIRRNDNMRVVVDSLINCIPTISAVVVLGSMFYLTFAILGVGLFSGKFYRCQDDPSLDMIPCKAQAKLLGKNEDKAWANPPYNFDNIFDAVRTLFICSTAEGWVEIMYSGMDVTEVGMAPLRNNERMNFIFFWGFMVIGSFFLTNIFIGVLVSFFGESSGTALLTHTQREWLQTQILILRTKSRVMVGPPEDSWQRPLYKIASSPILEKIVSVLVTINVVALMFESVPQDPVLLERLDVVNLVFLLIFTLEMAFKMVAFGPADYWRDNWAKLDVFVVFIGWVGHVANLFAVEFPGIQAIRSLRILRITMLLKTNKTLRSLFGTLLMSLPPALNLTMLWMLVFFIYGVLGMQYFWDCAQQPGPEVGFLNANDNFKDIIHSMRFLFQISTGQDFMNAAYELENAGARYAFYYFGSFVVISIWMFSNLFVAVLLENFEINFTTENLELHDDDVAAFKEEWVKYASGPDFKDISAVDIEKLVPTVPAPLSNCVGHDAHWLNRIFFELEIDTVDSKLTSRLSVDDSERRVGFHELLIVLCLMNATYDGLSFEQQQRKREVIKEKESLFAEKIIGCCVRAFLAARAPPPEFADTDAGRRSWAMRCQVARTIQVRTIVRLNKIKRARTRA